MATPDYRIAIDGIDMTPGWRREHRLLEIETVDRDGSTSDSCRLVLDDRPPHVDVPAPGSELNLMLGAELVEIGRYFVDVVEASCPPHRLSISAHATPFVGPMAMQSHRSRAWPAISVVNMANVIARDHGLIARVQPAIAGETISPCEQIEETDLVFFKRLLAGLGARVSVRRGKESVLEVVAAGSVMATRVLLTPKTVEEWQAPLMQRQKFGRVVARWIDPKSGEGGHERAGDIEPTKTVREVFATAEKARKAAKSFYEDSRRQVGQLSLTLTALRPDIYAGTPVELTGFRAEIDRVWNVVEVRHRLTAGAVRTSLVAEISPTTLSAVSGH